MEILSVQSVIKKSVLNTFNTQISSTDMLLSLIIAFGLALFIVYVYRKTFTGVVYNKSFALCIIMLSMVTAMIIRTISSNIALSLGMVGALSIVRFRTAVKDPVDTGFMFYAISAGIMTGAGMYLPAIIATIIIGICYFGAYLMGFRVSNRYLLILKYNSKAHDDVVKKLKLIRKYKIRSKSIYDNNVELSLEVDIKEGGKTGVSTSIVDQFENINGIINASLIAYQNDFGD